MKGKDLLFKMYNSLSYCIELLSKNNIKDLHIEEMVSQVNQYEDYIDSFDALTEDLEIKE